MLLALTLLLLVLRLLVLNRVLLLRGNWLWLHMLLLMPSQLLLSKLRSALHFLLSRQCTIIQLLLGFLLLLVFLLLMVVLQHL